MSPSCSAPVHGHRTLWSRAKCPVHGLRKGRSVTIRDAILDARPVLPKEYLKEQNSKDPAAAPDVLARLAKDKSIMVRYNLAENPSTPPETLALLAADEGADVRIRIACRSDAPVGVLELLATDSDRGVRSGVAGNPSLPASVVASLAADEYFVHKGLGKNPSTPPEVLVEFASAEDRETRFSVAKNPNLPAPDLVALTQDENDFVRGAALFGVASRICDLLDVDSSNEAAIDILRDQAWWDMTPESPGVILAKALSPNP